MMEPPTVNEETAEQEAHYRAQIAALLPQIDVMRLKLGKDGRRLSDMRFCERFGAMKGPMLTQLRSGSYRALSWRDAAEKLRTTLASANAYAEKLAGASGLVMFQFVQDIITGVTTAKGEGRRRLVTLLAESGGGKTTLLRFLRAQSEWGGTLVAMECHEGHKGSEVAFLHDVSLALDIEPKKVKWQAMVAIREELKKRNCVFFLDEMHHLSPAGLNMVKHWINTTACVFVFAAIPELWERLVERDAYAEAAQLITRTGVLRKFLKLDAADAALYCEAFAARWNEATPENRHAIAAKLATECSAKKKGMLDAADLFVKHLNNASEGDAPTKEDAEKAALNLRATR